MTQHELARTLARLGIALAGGWAVKKILGPKPGAAGAVGLYALQVMLEEPVTNSIARHLRQI